MISILLVDDQKTIRERMKLVLKQEPNFQIVGTASNGFEAIKLAAELAPDIILMDLEMPYLDGLQATELICQQKIDTNILILTSKKNRNLLVQSLNAGAKGYLLKRSSVREIINEINFVYHEDKFIEQESNKPDRMLLDSNGQKKNQAIETKVFEEAFNIDNNASKIDTLPEVEFYQPQAAVAPPKNKLNLFLLLTVLKRRSFPALMGFFGVLLGAVIYLIFAQRMYQATALITLEDSQESISDLGKNLSNPPANRDYSSLSSQVTLIESKSVFNNALKNLVREQAYSYEEILLEVVKGDVGAKVIPNTNILEVSYENPDPELSASFLNETIQASIARNVEIIQSEARSVKEFLQKEVSKQKEELNRAETAENRYREEKGIIDLDNQTQNLVNTLNDLETQEQSLLAQIKEQESKVNSLQQIAEVEDIQSAYDRGIIGQNEQLESLRTQLTSVEEQLATARANFTDNNPTVVALLEKRDRLLELYRGQVREIVGENPNLSPLKSTKNEIDLQVLSDLITTQAQLEADREKLQAIQTEKAKANDRISSLPASVQPLATLVRQREQANESLQFLQRQLEEARIAEAQLVSNLQVVELAEVPVDPSWPNIPLVLAVASLVGITLATGIILLLETIDRTLYEGAGLESQLHIPLLASLPCLQGSTNNLTQIQSFLQNSTLYEPYRNLLKRLESSSKQLKVIVVTSAIAEEGKTVVASHLAAVSAMLSKRTLIIDAHLHQGDLHNWFDVRLQPGLTESVTNGLELGKLVQPTKIRNLSVIAAGKSVSNSCTIVESPEIESIIKQAAMQYELVIVDTPSVSSNCDAYTLSKYSNGLVMVTRPLHTTTNILEETVVDLKRNQAAIIGFAINNTNKQKNLLYGDRIRSSKKSRLLPGSNKAERPTPDKETKQL